MTNQLQILENEKVELSFEQETIAQAMVEARGDIALTSRNPEVAHNAMELRAYIRANPQIRTRYYELLTYELQECGLHITERILKLAELQQQAMGYSMKDSEGGTLEIPANIPEVISLSKEISRLIAEGKNQNISAKSAVILASKEDAKEILENFLNS